MTPFGAKLRDLRKSRDITLKDMAASLEIDAVIDPAQTRAWLTRALAAGHTGPLRGGMIDTW